MTGEVLCKVQRPAVGGGGLDFVGVLLAFGCGLVSLAFQGVWARWVGLYLGQEVLAGCGAIAGTLVGMALGAWGYGRVQGRWLEPCGWYLLLQAVKTLWLLVAAALLPAAAASAVGVIGLGASDSARWTLALAIPSLACLPVTLAVGAEWAALAGWRDARARGTGAAIEPTRAGAASGLFYAAHTGGACVGVWWSVSWLLPRFGFASAVLILALVSALLLAVAGCQRASGERMIRSGLVVASAAQGERWGRGCVLMVLWVGGVLGMAFEMICLRALAQIFENTAFSFAAIVAAFLACNALGAVAEGGWRLWRRTPFAAGRWGPWLGLKPAVGMVGEMPALGFCGVAMAVAVAGWVLHVVAGSGAPAGLTGIWEGGVALGVLGPAAGGMGWVFCRLAWILQQRGGALADAAAASALGGAVGAVLGVLGLVPGFGIKGALGLVCLAYVGLGWRVPGLAVAVAAFCGWVFWVLPDPLPALRLVEGARALWLREGAGARVAVIEGADRHRVLQVNNRYQMGGTAAVVPQKRQAHVPLALHPRPRRALFIGPGTGITLAGAVEFPGLAIDAVELLDEVVAAMPFFEPHNAGVAQHPAVRVLRADARRFVRGMGGGVDGGYDVIVCDLFHPALDGAGGLYTTDHFAALRGRLAAGGLICQWIPVYQFDEPSLRRVVRSFLAVFPDAAAWLLQPGIDVPVIGLVGSLSPLEVTPRWLEGEREESAALRSHWRAVGLQSTVGLVGSCVAGAEGLQRFAGKGDLNTDAHPRLWFEPPLPGRWEVGGPGRLLLRLVEAGRASAPSALRLRAGEGGEEGVREAGLAVVAYGGAMEGYLRGLLEEQAGDVEAALERYLAAAGLSVYFTPAYARCVTVIRLKAAQDRGAARVAYERLQQARPELPLARQILGPLFEEGDR